MIGLLLSDGYLNSTSNKDERTENTNFYFSYTQSLTRFEYFWSVFNHLAHYCSSLPNKTTQIRAGKRNYGLKLNTRALPCFTKLHQLFYDNGTKEISKDIFYFLDSVALSQWISGDGKYVKTGGITLCTDSYSEQSIQHLIIALTIRHNLKCSIHIHDKQKKHYRIYIKKESIPALAFGREIVKPHLHPSMYYKIHS